MGTLYPDIFKLLAAPFPPGDVKKKPAQGGKQLSYITARVAMNRLDEVLGPENWSDDYEQFGTIGGVKCILTIILPEGEKVTKTGIGGTTEMHDQSDTDKTGESDAFKRAAVKFGVGRYLYQDGVPQFNGTPAPPSPAGPPPTLAPVPAPVVDAASVSWSADNPDPLRKYGSLPKHGNALFPWGKKLGDEQGMGIVKYLNGWGVLNGLTDPGDATRTLAFKEWPDPAVQIAAAEVCRKLYSKAGVDVPAEPLTFTGPAESKDDDHPFDGAPLSPLAEAGALWMRRGELREAVKRIAEHYYGKKFGKPHVEDVKAILRAASPKVIAWDNVDTITSLQTVLDLIEVAAGVEDVLRGAPDERFGVPVPDGLSLKSVPVTAGFPGMN